MLAAPPEPGRPRRLLFLSPYPPHPDAPHGGARVTAQLLAGLAERHEVALLHLRGEGDVDMEPALAARCRIVEELPRRGPRRSPDLRARVHKHVRALSSLAALRPKWAEYCAVPALAERLRRLVQEWRPEVVQAEYHVMGQYLAALDGRPVRRVLNQYEPGAAAAQERWRSRHGGRRPRQWLELMAWERYERGVARHTDAVVVFTERDRREMAARAPGRPVVIIPLATTLPVRSLDPAGRPPPAVLFAGSYAHPPNLDAALRLAASIFPRVRQRCPEAVLWLVGDAPPEELRAAAGAGVTLTGRVPSVEPWLDRAAVVVAPLVLGGGMRVKVLEALAAGKAVVASPRAAEGLEGAPLVLAEGDEETAEAVAGLLADREARIALATRARAWALAHLGWDRAVAAYEALYERLLREEAP
ncbi:MAG TPA: glycosyltransferase family 4 protein [Thermoanaerobaculia bacterium]|nr:glycosyltransferase family 4 protein [Thermoanaerobaculia bacterium]